MEVDALWPGIYLSANPEHLTTRTTSNGPACHRLGNQSKLPIPLHLQYGARKCLIGTENLKCEITLESGFNQRAATRQQAFNYSDKQLWRKSWNAPGIGAEPRDTYTYIFKITTNKQSKMHTFMRHECDECLFPNKGQVIVSLPAAYFRRRQRAQT